MKIFLERNYSHRHPGAIVAALLLVAMGSFLIWAAVYIFVRGESYAWVGLIILTCPSGLFLYAGIRMAYAWISHKSDNLIISDEGIEHFGKLVNWDKIKWLSYGSKKKGEFMLFYQKPGIGFDRYLPVSNPLAEDEIKNLFSELESALGSKYKHLEIG